jgi:anti-sigma factor RsiW
MKETEFIELLNLYLDHEISPADTARLEAEIRGNPERRRVYRQYCRMEQACKLIAADFTSEDEGAVVAAERKVISFSPQAARASHRRPATLGYAVAALAAAAGVALVFVAPRGSDVGTDAMQPVAASDAAVAAPPGAVPVASLTTGVPRGLISVARPVPPPSLVANPLLLTGSTQAEAVRAAAVRQADNQLAWLETLQLAPLPERRAPSNELHFTQRLVTEGRALGQRNTSGPKQPEPGEEMVTFQIVK